MLRTSSQEVCELMAIVQVVRGDLEVAEGGLIIFPVLTVLSYGGLFYLVKDKIRRP
jgi:hypothetical protein